MTILASLHAPPATSYEWVDYFYRNAPEPQVPWSDAVRLSGAERLVIIRSVQQFQLGEGATGARMLARAQRFSREKGDLGLIAALKLFLREEQRHSRILAQFLELEKTPCLRKNWVDNTFRWLRGLAGLELCLKVLVTAELLARPYYAALRDATGSPLLRSICQLIFDEESAHLRFQAFLLGQFEKPRALLTRHLMKALHAGLLAPAAALLWFEHRSVFRSANRTFRQFWHETWCEFDGLYQKLPA